MGTWSIVASCVAAWAFLRMAEVLFRHLLKRRRDKRSYRAWRARRGETLTTLQREAHERVRREEAERASVSCRR